MPQARLGAASLNISISDVDGFTVRHGTDDVTLLHKPPELCRTTDWIEVFAKLREVACREMEDAITREAPQCD